LRWWCAQQETLPASSSQAGITTKAQLARECGHWACRPHHNARGPQAPGVIGPRPNNGRHRRQLAAAHASVQGRQWQAAGSAAHQDQSLSLMAQPLQAPKELGRHWLHGRKAGRVSVGRFPAELHTSAPRHASPAMRRPLAPALGLICVVLVNARGEGRGVSSEIKASKRKLGGIEAGAGKRPAAEAAMP